MKGAAPPASRRPSHIERFREIIAGRLGLRFEDDKLGFLAEVLERRIRAGGISEGAYLARLEGEAGQEPARDELRLLAPELTVPETYFFRNAEQFRALADVVLPARILARAPSRKLELLSAGCASGEEPYSLAIAVRDKLRDPAWDVSIRGVDVSPAALDRARRARFSAWSLRETPADVARRWFRAEGREFVLDPAVRAAVRFDEKNLTQDDAELWQPGLYDVVFCRNAIMYLTPDAARALVARIARSLVPGGYFFLGHAETLRYLSEDFSLCHTHGTFYYERKGRGGREKPPPATPAEIAPVVAPHADGVADRDASWVEAIGRASARIRALAEGPDAGVSPSAEAPEGARDQQLADAMRCAMELLKEERFSEALELLPSVSSAPDVLLLRAALLTQSGRFDAAERACEQLLVQGGAHAGARFLLALCREGQGDATGALEHARAAVLLGPDFAMPQLHLGLTARRRGDLDAARRALGRALELLEREDPLRLLLFGGGFGREALIALCRNELATCGAGS